MDMYFPKFDIYQSTVAPNCFKNHANSWCPDFLQKNVLSDVRSETDLVPTNIVSTEQFVGWLARLVSQFACNTRVIVDASSNLTVSCVKLL